MSDSTNEELGLPTTYMKKVTVAFDIDGTLIRNTGTTPADPDVANERIVELLKTLASFKNIRIVVWSGGGEEYAAMWVQRLGLEKYVWKTLGKVSATSLGFKPDIAIDDIQDTALGVYNLIVREK